MSDIGWLELRGELPEEFADEIAALLFMNGVEGVQTVTNDFLPPGEKNPPKKGRARLICYLEPTTTLDNHQISRVKDLWQWFIDHQNLPADFKKLEILSFDGENWKTEWKKYFHPIRVSDRISVYPAWEKENIDDTEFSIEIDPGMAFGTGGHETTSLLLKMLDKFTKKSEFSRMLDVGTGSGILSIAAKKLGIESIVAIDNDPIAVEIAKQNFEINDVDSTVCVASDVSLADISASFPIVCANIISSVLMLLKDRLVEATEKGGLLLLSGILLEDKEDFLEAFTEETTLKVIETEEQAEWVAIALIKE